MWLLLYKFKEFYWTIAYNGLQYCCIIYLYWWMQPPSVMITTGLCKCWFSPGLFPDWPTPFLCPWSPLPWSHPRFNRDNNTTTCVSTQQVSLFLHFPVCFLYSFLSFFLWFLVFVSLKSFSKNIIKSHHCFICLFLFSFPDYNQSGINTWKKRFLHFLWFRFDLPFLQLQIVKKTD